ncbi:PPPDE putative peptidase domain-containing protein [Lineolata rhizophorae]|uniref:PPPDE putative peptidase domain-containing protein n=1 Tax=Lineolata rhizophorae TaxID=578093 RepID=A0A6A6NLR5_9PEZI|nr:PPPDE putative peptidase domain-containing protein [Lineolata rhizophorae]
MEAQLYVYDLSMGMARQFSEQFLGTRIDAVYHTSIVLGGIEYFFGRGIQTCPAGATHHGRPMEILPLGKTEIPHEIILEYLDSLKQIYTAESYDLFLHNCNNFSNDFAMFLVGCGIPEHITSLPQTVLNTPFGQMLRPILDQQMRSITQAPTSMSSGLPYATGEVHNVTTLNAVERLLSSAKNSCAILFFTSSTCAPCKIMYPAYDRLAAEGEGKCVLIKVDINAGGYEAASKYNVRATPTFIAFLRGAVHDRWSGADEGRLRTNFTTLLNLAYPPHPHRLLELPNFLGVSLRPVTFAKVPPLEKVLGKLGEHAKDAAVASIAEFIRAREANKDHLQEAPLPDLTAFAAFLRASTTEIPVENRFAAYDLLRLALLDARVAGFFVEETHASPATTTSSASGGPTTTAPTLVHLISHTNRLPIETTPYALRLVTLHVACNLFATPLSQRVACTSEALAHELVDLLGASLNDTTHTTTRAAAAGLAFNFAAANHRARMEKGEELLGERTLFQLVTAVLHPLMEDVNKTGSESGASGTSKEVIRGMSLALGLMVYCLDENEQDDGTQVRDVVLMHADRKMLMERGEDMKDEVVKDVGKLLMKGF